MEHDMDEHGMDAMDDFHEEMLRKIGGFHHEKDGFRPRKQVIFNGAWRLNMAP